MRGYCVGCLRGGWNFAVHPGIHAGGRYHCCGGCWCFCSVYPNWWAEKRITGFCGALSPQKIFSKQNIYESIWQEEYAYDNDTINTHISNIRKKIKKHTDTDYIETVWGIGYKLK